MQELSTISMKFEKAMAAGKQAREGYHVAVGVKLKEALDRSIDASGINDEHGTVKRWQVTHVGSGGGYVAIRATSVGDEKHPSPGKNSPGAITNYLENGHKVREPKTMQEKRKKDKSLRKWDTRRRVDGRGFYLATRKQAQMIALQEADRIVKAIEEAFG